MAKVASADRNPMGRLWMSVRRRAGRTCLHVWRACPGVDAARLGRDRRWIDDEAFDRLLIVEAAACVVLTVLIAFVCSTAFLRDERCAPVDREVSTTSFPSSAWQACKPPEVAEQTRRGGTYRRSL